MDVLILKSYISEKKTTRIFSHSELQSDKCKRKQKQDDSLSFKPMAPWRVIIRSDQDRSRLRR